METAISLAAFLVAAVALYASNLKRADIRVAPLTSAPPRLIARAWIQPEPKELGIQGQLFAYNAGARGGVLEAFGQVSIAGSTLMKSGSVSVGLIENTRGTPYAMESGEVQVLVFNVPVVMDSPASPDPRDRAKHLLSILTGISSIRVTIKYTFIKGYSINPFRRGRPVLKTREANMGVDAEGLIRELQRLL